MVKRIRELKAGDIIKWRFKYEILEIKPGEGPDYLMRLKQLGDYHGDNPIRPTEWYNYHGGIEVTIPTDNHPMPCLDSDCECVFSSF